MNQLYKNKIAFVILTCDNYSDLWSMFIHFFEKNWKDCPLDKYFVTNYLSIPESSFDTLKIGNDESWSDGLLKAIAILKKKYDYLIITLEDWPIIEKVDNDQFDHILDIFLKENGNYLTFRNKPKPTHKFNKLFGKIEKGSLYRPSCVYSLWKIDVLEKLLVKEENAWEFERFGSIRSDKFDKFFVVYKDFFKICNTVVKGKWVRSEYKRIKKLGFTPNISDRDLFSPLEELKLKTNEFIFNIFNRITPIPWNIRRKIVFKIKGYSYPKNIY